MNKQTSNKEKTVLENYKLKYEDMKFKKPKIVKKFRSASVSSEVVLSNKLKKKTKSQKFDIRGKIVRRYKKVSGFFANVVNKVRHPRKKAKKITKRDQEIARLWVVKQRFRAIMGIGLLLVVVSIAYSTYIIFIGVDSTASKLALLPQALFALIILVKAFSKLYK